MRYSIEPRERRYVNKIANKITAKPYNKDEVINGIPKERYISPKERQKIIDKLKLA